MMIAVVEDSPIDRERITMWMHRYWTERYEQEPLHVMTYSSGDDFIKALTPGRFALVLMDCRMEGTNGLEAARKMRACDQEAVLIFTTSSRDYAVDGYQVAASGYLVKPFTYETFEKALEQAWPRMPGCRACLHFPGAEPVFFEDIVYCDIDKHYAQVHLPGPKVLRIRMTFSKLLESLTPSEQFLLCYRGCVINMDHVQKMEDLNFLMDTEERVPFRKKEHVKLMRQYSSYLFEKTRRGYL